MNAKIIAIANQKGGVGKTTSSLSLAAALTRMGRKLLVLDLDPHVCASIHLRYYPEEERKSLVDLFKAQAEDYAYVWSEIIVRNEVQTFDLAVGSTKMSALEAELKDLDQKGFILTESLKLQRPNYDYIILDCPPHMGIILANSLVASDLLIIPIQTDFLALHGLKLIFDTITTLNKALDNPIFYRTLATMYDKRAKACTRVLEMLRNKMGQACFETIIPLDTRFRDASALGKLIYDLDPNSRGAKAYTELAKELELLW